MSGFVLHPEAERDLDELWEYIASDNLDAADRVREEIYSAIQALVRFPHKGHRRPDLSSGELRFQVVREYLLAYSAAETPLLVLAVLHGRRSPRVIAAMLRDRG